MSVDLTALPKCELHVHLEGSLRPDTMRALAARHDTSIHEDLGKAYEFGSFDEFVRLFMLGLSLLRDAEDFCAATVALATELAAQNVRYVEVTTTAFSHARRGVPVEEYVAGLDEGRRRAGEMGVELAWVIDIPRSLEPPDSGFTADLLLSGRAPAGVVGIGLGGPEVGHPPNLYEASFRRAKAAGLLSLPHAGETAGADDMWQAVDLLEADRIGHGVRCLEDPRLVEHLATTGLPLEVCITSNLLLGVAPSVEEHPIRRLREAGVRLSVNTDDPGYFSTTLSDELGLAAGLLGSDEVVGLVEDAFACSALDGSRRAALLAELRAAIRATPSR